MSNSRFSATSESVKLTLAKWYWAWLTTLALWFAGVVATVISGNIRVDLSDQRRHVCDGTIPMPVSGYLFAWIGLIIGIIAAAAAFLLMQFYRVTSTFRGDRPTPDYVYALVVILRVLAALAVLLEVLFLYGIYQVAVPYPDLCSG